MTRNDIIKEIGLRLHNTRDEKEISIYMSLLSHIRYTSNPPIPLEEIVVLMRSGYIDNTPIDLTEIDRKLSEIDSLLLAEGIYIG